MQVWWLLLLTVMVIHESLQHLQGLPIIANMLRDSVHPIFRPFINQFKPRTRDREDETDITSICFGEIGCIYNTDDFYHPIYRPLNTPPSSREEIRVLYTLVTRDNPEGTIIEAEDITTIVNTSFSSKRKTKILIHGFFGSNGITWILDMVCALLAYDDLNVIAVDWSRGSRAWYTQATANSRVVGLEIAYLVNWLQDNDGLQPKDVHIIGHSLASHIAGYAGERITGLGRITGLDPAEPLFQYMPPAVRLDPTDANFVDVIHTDIDSILCLAQGFGMWQPVGHIDFYPNGGHEQPGCGPIYHVPITFFTDGINLLEGLNSDQMELAACNHFRSAKLFTDSIQSQCPYMAFQCDSYKQYLDGDCMTCGDDGSGCAHMGYHADSWTGVHNQTNASFYLSTTTGPHYCVYHYHLTVELGDPDEVGGSLRGNLKASFFTEDGNIRNFDLTPDSPGTFARGKSYSYLLEYAEDLISSTDALVHWSYEADMFNPLSYFVAFRDRSFPLAKLTFASVDKIVSRKRKKKFNRRSKVVNMCHTQGRKVIRIASGENVRVVDSSYC